MRRSLLLLFILIMLAPSIGNAEPSGYGKATQGEIPVTWAFDLQVDDNSDTPRGKVYLVVRGRKVLVLPAAIGNFSVIERTNYKGSRVPATAITGCSGWWAGQGEDLYVIRRRNQLVVFIRYLDEGADVPAYRRLKVIPLR